MRYPAGDTVSAGLAEAFATDARSIGVQVDLEPVTAARADRAAVVGFGDPFDPDLALYALLRSGKGALGGYVNDDGRRGAGRPAARRPTRRSGRPRTSGCSGRT